jgi:hypothetical protein
MPLATFDLFARIVATRTGNVGRLNALAVETTGGSMFMAARLLAYLGTQGIVQALPVTAVTPLPKINDRRFSNLDTPGAVTAMGCRPPLHTGWR